MEDNYDIQLLIETKSFEELTLEEKNVVLKDITKDEYIIRRKVIENIQLFLKEGVADMKPKKELKTAVAAIMQAKKAAQFTNICYKIFTYKIPVYVPAMAVLLLLFALPLFYNNAENKIIIADVKETASQIIYKTDTITIEKEVPKYLTVTQTKYIQVIKKQGQLLDSIDPINALEEESVQNFNTPNSMVFNNELLENQIKNIGKSNGEQEELNKFLVVSK